MPPAPADRLCVPVRGPFPWKELLAYYALRGTPGLDIVEDGAYRRQTPAGPVSVVWDDVGRCLTVSPPADSAPIRHMFDTDCDTASVARVLGACGLLGPRVRRLPGVRVPGCWEPFELCLRVVLGQQVSVKGAATLMRRLAGICPGLAPAAVAAADVRSIGVPARRAQTLHELARGVAHGAVDLRGPWPEAARALLDIPGIGPWTVSYLAIRLGRDPDGFPESDLRLLKASGARSSRDLLRLAERWRPWRAYAAMYLWTCPA